MSKSEDDEDVSGPIEARRSWKAPKNPKGSARAKYNRRKVWLTHAIEQMEIAIDHLLEQPGAVYKVKEAETLKAAIETFRQTTGLKGLESPTPTQEQMDRIMDVLTNGEPWSKPSDEVMEELRAVLEVAKAEGLDIENLTGDATDVGDND